MTMTMNTWTALREALLLIEAAEYRGQSGLRFVDLISLVGAIIDPDNSMERAERERRARALLNPAGGAMNCNYEFSRKIWGDWVNNANAALAKAGTDSSRKSSQYPGEPRGGTVMKRNYGGRVIYQPGRRDQSHEQQPSAMDTYDVLMRADGDTMTRFAYAPSQGRFEERAARLEDLMAGRGALPLKRRPQPEMPDTRNDPTKPPKGMDPDEEQQWIDRVRHSVPDAPVAGGANRTGRGDKYVPPRNDSDTPAPPISHYEPKAPFADRMAGISKRFDKSTRRETEPGDEPDDDGPLFPKKR